MRFHILYPVSIIIAFTSSALASPVSQHAARAATSPATVTSIHEFTPGTWVENLAVRANGQILATLLNTPQVYQVDPNPASAHPVTLVHTFPSYLGCLGITELRPDVFYVVVGNFSLAALATTPGSYSVWELNMAGFAAGGSTAAATKIADFPQSVFLNGITSLQPAGNTLLIADSGAGAVYSLNVDTGAVRKVIADPLMAPTAGANPATGINGVKVRGQTLYFSNTDQTLLGKVALNADGSAAGAATAVVRNATGADDFQLDTLGNLFIAGDSELRFHGVQEGAGGPPDVVSTSSLLAGSTAVEFGRLPTDLASVYVSTNGGQAQYFTKVFTDPGKIVKVDVLAAGWPKVR